MKFFRSRVVVWVIVSIMILGLVAAYMPLFFGPASAPEPTPVSVEQPSTPPPVPLVLIPTSTATTTSR